MPGIPSKFILDSSFFLSGTQPPEGQLFTVPSVVDEVRPGRKELLICEALGMQIRSPTQESMERIEETAKKTGDISRVSRTDMELIALALELQGTLFTDDYSMQNISASLGVKFHSLLQRGIRKIAKWYYRCKYCGKYQETEREDCGVCGGPIKTTRKPPKGKGKR
jgi:endoribonuclease Nob1